MSKLIGMTCLAMLFSDGFWSTINAQEIPDKAKSESSALLDEEPSLDEPRGDKSSSTTATQNAGDKNWNLRAKRILEIGGETFADANQKNKAYKELGSLKPSSDSDPRYSYAFILVAMKEKQWSSAQKLVTELLECHEDYLPARAAKARMLLTLEKKLAAVAELELLAKGLESSSTIVSDDQLTEAARFLGLGVGYFEGPGKDSIKATALQALIATADEIPQSLQEPYSQARLAIENEYQVLMEKGEDALAAHKQEIAEDT